MYKIKKKAYNPPVSRIVSFRSEGMLALSVHSGTTAGAEQWGTERGEDFSSGYWDEGGFGEE